MEREIIDSLANTIALLGGKRDILSLVNEIGRGNDQELLRGIRNYNISQVTEVKDRLHLCSIIKVKSARVKN
jgi:hypothetical protein